MASGLYIFALVLSLAIFSHPLSAFCPLVADPDDFFDRLGAECVDYDESLPEKDRGDLSSGKLSFSIGTSDDIVRSIIAQSDGRLVVTGRSAVGLVNQFVMIRFDIDGNLDPTFNTSGLVVVTFGTLDSIGHKVFCESNGNLFSAGRSIRSGGNMDFLAVRYLPSGALDTAFATIGYTQISIGTGGDISRDFSVDSSGRYYLSGYTWTVTGGNYYIGGAVRIVSNGQLDTAFNTTGRLTLDFYTSATGLLATGLDTSGRLMVAGTAFVSDWNMVVGRVQTNGTLDTTFQTKGYVLISLGTAQDQLYDLKMYGDKIILIGSYHNGTNMDGAVIRLMSDGSFDTSFATTGKATRSFSSGDDYLYDLDVDAGGAIVGAGYSSNSNQDFLAVRYASNGTLDTFFSTIGFRSTSVSGTNDQAMSLYLASSGQMYLSGRVINGATDSDVALTRYSAAGTPATSGNLDDSFGTAGVATISLVSGSSDQSYGIVFQPEGKIVITGVSPLTADQFEAIRLMPNGSLDTSFSTIGKSNFGPSSPGASSTSWWADIFSDGKLAVFGEVSTGSAVTLRLTTNGKIDTAFATIGYVLNSGASKTYFGLYASDGRIYSADYDPAVIARVVRFNSNGTLDTAYRTTGVASWTGPANEIIRVIAKDAEDRIIMVGDNLAAYRIPSIGRFTTNGNLDTAFFTVGWRHLTTTTGTSAASGISVDAKGRLWVGVSVIASGANDDFTRVYRLLSNGTFDTSFGTIGYTDTSIGADLAAYRAQLIVTATDKVIVDTQRANFLSYARLNSNGTLDTSFNTAGMVSLSYASFLSYRIRLSPDGRICGANSSGPDFSIFCFWP